MPNTPVPPDFDRTALRREVNTKVQRFLSAAASSTPEGGKTVTKHFRAAWQGIAGLSGQSSALYSINGNGRILVGEVAAVCFLGSQDVILLRIFYRIGENKWVEYEYAFCEEKGRVGKWTDARELYRSLAQRQSDTAPPIDIDMAKVRTTAQETLDRIIGGGRVLRLRGAKLTGAGVEDQIKGLKPVFTLGPDAREAAVGTHCAVCFASEATGLNLRVYRHGPDGWQYVTFVLDVRHSRPTAQHRGRRGGDVKYRWK